MSYGVDTRRRRSPLVLGLATAVLAYLSMTEGGLIGLGLGVLAGLFGIGFLRSLTRPPEEHGFGQVTAPMRSKRVPVDVSIPDTPAPDRRNPMPEIDALIARGANIDAIKLYREQTGTGLKEAKDAVEARIAELRGSGRQKKDGPWG